MFSLCLSLTRPLSRQGHGILMLPALLLLLLLLLPGGTRARGKAANDWQAVQPPLQEVLRGLWVPDRPRAAAGPAAAASALSQALWLPGGQPMALLKPLFALGEAAARAEQAEVVVESLRLIEDASHLAAHGGHATPEQVTQLHRRLAELYTQQFIPLVHSGLLSMAERTNGRSKAISAAVGDSRSQRVAVGPSAVLLSSSHWATMIITLVRGLHQKPARHAAWRHIRHNLRTTCPSSQTVQDDTAWRQLAGAEVLRWETLTRLVEGCLVDADSIGTMMHVEGGDADASNTAGWSPLHHAALLASGQIAAALLAAGAAPLARTALLGYTALHIAASRGASDVAKVLLSHAPALISAVDVHNRTAIDIVCLHDPAVLDSAKQGNSWLWETYRILRAAGAAPCVSHNGSDTGVAQHEIQSGSKRTNAARVEPQSKVSRPVPARQFL